MGHKIDDMQRYSSFVDFKTFCFHFDTQFSEKESRGAHIHLVMVFLLHC